MASHYDVIIIGAGPGGYSTALRLAELGRSVAIVERDATVGGTCLNRGCIPTKALLTVCHTLDLAKRSRELGVDLEMAGIDYGRLADYRRATVDAMVKGLSGLLRHRGIEVIRGEATLTGEGSVRVASRGEDGADTTADLTAGDVVIATGARSRPLPGMPFGAAVIDSDAALTLDEFPASAIVIGAGAVALEFASIWHSAGCDVTLMIRKDRVLSRWNRRTSMMLTREFKRQGVTVLDRTAVKSVDTGANLGARVHYTRGDDPAELTREAELVLVAIGRDPNTDEAWFRDRNIALDGHGRVVTDAYGRTSMPRTWAVGDVTAGPQLAHRAFEQGIVVAESIAGLSPAPSPVDDMTIPEVVYSHPEAASVGLTLDEAEARDDFVSVTETQYPMLSNSRVLMSGANGSLSLVTGCAAADPDTPLVLGVHMVGPNVSEIIAEAEQLVGNRVPVHRAARLIHPHPTVSEALGEALLKADGRPLHTR
ncbi:dihydrolipoyl dehydrogenase [Bifidobacterium avesanii]|uniref:Dihydrolipoyl dehydrogenase n=1 Tax=Bifidobacterium avesanii TaxID=1798157 RepID=A0A7K3TG23_9BIFI|nr:dihydrolipoyl dehydrogenase [Bifidobacterium avesanii]KAB8295576.1 dihydrolipoamide dehydrogenase [Bifidobacterium avesanii]NEG77580.1 dihydrolipoyl dehydrogenase [Bifidobacterium avesanii]